MAKASKAIKVCLTNGGDDVETPWAHDLGPAPGPKGARKVRLVNVPFMHAKPTWGDVVIVAPVKDGFPTWDRSGVTWSDIATRIHEDGGRWAMIIDYVPAGHIHADDEDACFDELAHACAELDIVCEGAWSPRGRPSGRVYLAVQNGTTDKAVMNHLVRAKLPCTLNQIHPASTPASASARVPARKPVKRAAAKKPAKKRVAARR